jgi:hypothetical protein
LTRPDPGALPQAGIVRTVGARDSFVAKKQQTKRLLSRISQTSKRSLEIREIRGAFEV